MEKKYFDVEGNPCTLYQLVEIDPGWAVSRITVGNKAIDRLNYNKELLAELKELAIREHDEGEYFCSEYEGCTCDCGADEHNAKVEKIYKELVGE